MLALLLMLSCGANPAQEPPVPDFCDNALELLGLSGAELSACTPMMPDVYWVLAGGGGHDLAAMVVTDNGRPVRERGPAAGAQWLRRIHVYDLDLDKPLVLAQALQWLEALPKGFEASHQTDHTDRTGASRLQLEPFRLELRRPEPTASAPGGGGSLQGSGSPGGGGVQTLERAVLTGDAAYRFTWTIERGTDGAWVALSSTPCE